MPITENGLLMAEDIEDVSGWVRVNDERTVWRVRNYHPWRIRLTIDRPPGDQRYSEFGLIPPMLDIELAGGQAAKLTLNEAYKGDWVADAVRIS